MDAGALKLFVPNAEADGVGRLSPGTTTEAEKEYWPFAKFAVICPFVEMVMEPDS